MLSHGSFLRHRHSVAQWSMQRAHDTDVAFNRTYASGVEWVHACLVFTAFFTERAPVKILSLLYACLSGLTHMAEVLFLYQDDLIYTKIIRKIVKKQNKWLILSKDWFSSEYSTIFHECQYRPRNTEWFLWDAACPYFIITLDILSSFCMR